MPGKKREILTAMLSDRDKSLATNLVAIPQNKMAAAATTISEVKYSRSTKYCNPHTTSFSMKGGHDVNQGSSYPFRERTRYSKIGF